MKIRFDLPNSITINGVAISFDRAHCESYGAHLVGVPFKRGGVTIGRIERVEIDYDRGILMVTADLYDSCLENSVD